MAHIEGMRCCTPAHHCGRQTPRQCQAGTTNEQLQQHTNCLSICLQRPCSQRLRTEGFEPYNLPTDVSQGGTTMACADYCDEDIGRWRQAAGGRGWTLCAAPVSGEGLYQEPMHASLTCRIIRLPARAPACSCMLLQQHLCAWAGPG